MRTNSKRGTRRTYTVQQFHGPTSETMGLIIILGVGPTDLMALGNGCNTIVVLYFFKNEKGNMYLKLAHQAIQGTLHVGMSRQVASLPRLH